MKTSLYLIAAYALICIGGTLGLSLLYMIYCVCTNLVSGIEMSLFSQYFFIEGFFLAGPVCAAVAPYFMILYLLRHGEKIFLPLITMALLSAASFLVLVPSLLNVGSYYETSFEKEVRSNIMSPGYFREDEQNVYYYTEVREDGTADGISYSKKSLDPGIGALKVIENQPVKDFASGSFKDVLIYNSVPMPVILKGFIGKIIEFEDAAFKILRRGYAHWLCFSSIALALIGAAAFIRLTGWRLLNTLLVFIVTSAIFAFNYLCYCSQALHPLSNFMHRTLPFTLHLYYPVPVCANALLFVLLLIVGIVVLAVRHNEAEEETV